MSLLWPDDVAVPTDRDGTLARLGGNQWYFASREVLRERPDLFEEHRAPITRYIIDNASSKPVELMTYNIDEIISRRPFSVSSKIEILLTALAQLTRHQVGTIQLTENGDNSVPYDLARAAGLANVAELMNLLTYAAGEGLAYVNRHSMGASVATTIPGLIYVEERQRADAENRSAFVAMWFADEMGPAFSEGMQPAIEANGFEAVRIDRREHNNKIDDEIISEIRRCRFAVADFSCGSDGARGGVYFEAGYALALGKPVIFTVRSSDLSKVHFDTRQFNHIVWEDGADLMPKLRDRIAATIGRFGEGQ